MLQNLIVPAFLAYFLAVWLGVCLLIARLGGWSQLAGRYRVAKLPDGKVRYFQSATISRVGLPCNYGACLTMIVNEQGLGLVVFPLLRPGHPPLFIPWTDFYNPRQRTVLRFWKFIDVEIGEPALVTMQLPVWLFEQANRAMSESGGSESGGGESATAGAGSKEHDDGH